MHQPKIQSSKIYKLQCVSFLGFGNFKNYSKRFPHTACITIEIVQMEYNSFILKIELSVIFCYRNIYIIQIFDHARSTYNITISHNIFSLLLTIPSTSACQATFFTLKRIHVYLCRMQSHDSGDL
jgi:hypothetical protein